MMAIFRATGGRIQGQVRSAATQSVLAGSGAEGMAPLTTTGSPQIMQRGGEDWVSGANIEFVSLHSSGDVWVQIGVAPTAAVGAGHHIGAGERREFSVVPGEKIAVIDG